MCGGGGAQGSDTAGLGDNVAWADRYKAWKASGSTDNFQQWQDSNRAAMSTNSAQMGQTADTALAGNANPQAQAAAQNAFRLASRNPNAPAMPQAPDLTDTLIRDAASGTIARLQRGNGRRQSFLGGGPPLGGSSLLGY